MPALRSGARPWIAAGALLLCAVSPPAAAGAATTTFDVRDGAVVQVIGRTASIVIRAWNRDTVELDWPDGENFVASRGSHQTSDSILIPTVNVEEQQSPDSVVVTTLLPEDFPIPKLAPGVHDIVRVVEPPPPPDLAKPPQHLTVFIPETTGLLNIRSGRSAVTLRDYHGTTIAAVGRGRVVFDNVSGDAFVQPLNGDFYARNSTFDRLRIRSNRANEVFDACRVKQIEATTLTGNILFDNGTFDPGLARFESDRGSIGLGVNGNAQFGTHTEDGHVLTVLPAAPPMPPLLGGDGNASLQFIGNGGPLVNVSSVHGDLFLYDGSLAERPPGTLAPTWQRMYDLLESNRAVGRRKALSPAFPASRPPPRGRGSFSSK